MIKALSSLCCVPDKEVASMDYCTIQGYTYVSWLRSIGKHNPLYSFDALLS